MCFPSNATFGLDTHTLWEKLKESQKTISGTHEDHKDSRPKSAVFCKTSNGRAYILNKHHGRQLSSNDPYEGLL